jgi:hypothetical protein
MKRFDPKQKAQGVGDTIAKITNFFGIDKIADAVAKLAGAKGCGCDERRQILNELFPYDNKIRKIKVLKQFKWQGIEYFEGQEVEVTKNHTLTRGIIILAKEGLLEEIL